jgi:hypothetical protein
MMTFIGPWLRKPLLSGVAEMGVPYGEPALQQGTDHHKLIMASMVNRRAEPMFAELARSPADSTPPREPAGRNRDVAARAGWICVKDR